MGSKRTMLQNGLGELLGHEVSNALRFVDLFAGSGSVAIHVAQKFPIPVLAFDLQSYSAVLAVAVSLVGRPRFTGSLFGKNGCPVPPFNSTLTGCRPKQSSHRPSSLNSGHGAMGKRGCQLRKPMVGITSVPDKRYGLTFSGPTYRPRNQLKLSPSRHSSEQRASVLPRLDIPRNPSNQHARRNVLLRRHGAKTSSAKPKPSLSCCPSSLPNGLARQQLLMLTRQRGIFRRVISPLLTHHILAFTTAVFTTSSKPSPTGAAVP